MVAVVTGGLVVAGWPVTGWPVTGWPVMGELVAVVGGTVVAAPGLRATAR